MTFTYEKKIYAVILRTILITHCGRKVQYAAWRSHFTHGNNLRLDTKKDKRQVSAPIVSSFSYKTRWLGCLRFLCNVEKETDTVCVCARVCVRVSVCVLGRRTKVERSVWGVLIFLRTHKGYKAAFCTLILIKELKLEDNNGHKKNRLPLMWS